MCVWGGVTPDPVTETSRTKQNERAQRSGSGEAAAATAAAVAGSFSQEQVTVSGGCTVDMASSENVVVLSPTK